MPNNDTVKFKISIKGKEIKVMEEKDSWEVIQEKTDEICELLKSFEGSKSDAAEYICYQAVTFGAENHYEGLGILTETLNNWREQSLKAMIEENEDNEE